MRQVGCNSAWLRCRYRDGCGAALEQYVASCDSLVAGRSLQIHCMMYCMMYCRLHNKNIPILPGNTTKCDVNCRLALIALISTTEGERLMQVASFASLDHGSDCYGQLVSTVHIMDCLVI